LLKDVPHGFELSYPAEWKAEKPFVGLAADHTSDIPVRLNVPDAAWMSVAVGDASIPADGVAKLASNYKLELENLGDTEVTNTACKLDGVDAWQLTFVDHGPPKRQVIRVIASTAGRFYTVEFKAPLGVARVPLDVVLKSFHFITGAEN
jgi:hypothetical protein